MQVKCLKKRNGEVTFDPIEMRAITMELYEMFLTTEGNDIIINRGWNLIPTRVTSI